MANHHATRVPTLLIGIGGIGGEIVREVEKSLQDYDKQFVSMICLDTNTNDLKKSEGQNIPRIQTSENQTVMDYLNQHREFLEWFPTNPLINSKNLTQGAGQIRSVSRLGALAAEDAHRFDSIKDAIDKITVNVGNPYHEMIRVMIVGSICGGTGSGMGIQLPFYVREIVEELAHFPRGVIRGLFITPELVEEKQDTNEKKKSVYVNGYAFMRELNAFYCAQMSQKAASKLHVEHYAPSLVEGDNVTMANPVPYDFLFLVEKSDREGQNIGGIENYIAKAAEIVKAQLFAAQITADAYSTEDNLIISSVEADGKKRYCGAGVSKAVYPEDEIIRYCNLRYAESLLQSYWLQIDRMVETRIAQQKRQMAVDHSLPPLDPQSEYRRAFDELTDPKKHDVVIQFGLLARELVSETEIPDEYGNMVIHKKRLDVSLLKEIEKHVGKALTEDKIAEDGEKCRMDMDLLEDPDQARAHIIERMNLLSKFEEDTNKLVGNLVSSCVESILPSDPENAKTYSDPEKNPYSVFAVLKQTHPIITRYVLYYLKEELLKKEKKHKAEAEALEKSETIFTKDYYREKTKDGKPDTVIDRPETAINKVNSGFLAKLFGVGGYSRLIREISNDTDEHIQRVKDHAVARLKAGVFRGVLDRIEILIEQYEKFFRELEAILRKRTAERILLEQKDERIRTSDLFVCCDPVCKKWLYAEFERKNNNSDVTLPDEIKETFFDTIFKEYSKQRERDSYVTAFVEEEISMSDLFENSILMPLIDRFDEVEFQHLHMDILSAISQEYKIFKQKKMLKINGTAVDTDNFSEADYFVSIATQLRELSRPYLSYSSSNQQSEIGKVLVFWGVNHDALLKYQQDTRVDQGAFNAMFGAPGNATYSAIDDDSFDEKELICYSAMYDLSIDNLVKYKKGRRAQTEYEKRLSNVCRGVFNVGTGADNYLRTVHPHLDKNWHKHAYLPVLGTDDELQAQKEIRIAFLLAVACRYCRYMESDEIMRWAFKPIGGRFFETLELDNRPSVRGSYYTLYQTLDENPVAVEDILEMDESAKEAANNTVRLFGANLDSLLAQPIIKGFIGRELTQEEIDDFDTAFEKNSENNLPINILDVLFSVYSDSFERTLISDLIGTLLEYINSYCLKMTNNQPGLSQKLTREIAQKIGENSKAKMNEEFRDLCAAFFA